jgi:hypothetical protein
MSAVKNDPMILRLTRHEVILIPLEGKLVKPVLKPVDLIMDFVRSSPKRIHGLKGPPVQCTGDPIETLSNVARSVPARFHDVNFPTQRPGTNHWIVSSISEHCTHPVGILASISTLPYRTLTLCLVIIRADMTGFMMEPVVMLETAAHWVTLVEVQPALVRLRL